MKRLACFLSLLLLASSLPAAEVEIITAPRKAPVKNDAEVRKAELAVVQRTMAKLERDEPVPARAIAVVREVPAPVVKKAVPASVPAAAPVTALARSRAAVSAAPAAAAPAASRQFSYKDRNGRVVAAPIVERYQKQRIVYPVAKVDPRISPKLTRAASIAQERAHAHSKSRCWRYVKNALLAAGVIDSYPKTIYAKQAGEELVRSYGFKKLAIRDPYKAPLGAVLVYGSRRAAGHVEIRTKTGFVSDFQNKKPSPRPLIGIYAKA